MIAGLTIALAQVNPVVGNVDYNLGLVKKALEECKGADIVVFPELIVSGYSPEDLILKESFVRRCIDAAKEFILSCKDMPAFILTTPWLDGEDTYNAALFVEKDEIKSIVYKKNLPNYGVFDERRVFKAGPLPEPVEFKGRKIGILICEDIWFEEGAKHLKSRGAEIILSPNGSPYSMTKRERRLEIARDRVRDTGIPLVYVNQIGGQDDIVYDGGSFILDETGDVVFQAPYCETYVGPVGKSAKEPSRKRSVYDVLKLALKDYIGKNSFPGIILGMSGGIDSALTAAIAVDALGADKVRCVMLPSPFTSNESFEDAEACCKALGCSYEVISINRAMKAFENTLPGLSGVAHENMQSRARAMILMSLSNQTGAMVLTTGNKSEIAVGYTTLYGDMCGGFNVLKDVYKTHVYALAQWRNTLSPVIPERIITKAPSAELRANQTDQDSLPPYDTLDAILDGLIERDLGVDNLVAEGHAKDLVLKVNRLLDLAEYKRRQSAPGPKISARAFGRERRYPITNGYRFAVEKA
jgi:NAD+ synthase